MPEDGKQGIVAMNLNGVMMAMINSDLDVLLDAVKKANVDMGPDHRMRVLEFSLSKVIL